MNMSIIKVFGDSRIKFLAPYVAQVNDTRAQIEIFGVGGATIRSTGSAVWSHTRRHCHNICFFMSGINDMTVWDDISQRYKFPFLDADQATDHFIGSIQQFETMYHTRFPRSYVLFATITGMDLHRYAFVQNPDHDHQAIVSETIQRVNREVVNINESNHVPTIWAASHVHRNRSKGRQTNYYDQLSDGLHPTNNLLEAWAHDIVNTAHLIS